MIKINNLPFEISDVCKKCIKEHMKKKKEWKIECSFIPKEFDKPDGMYPLKKLLTEEEYFCLDEEVKSELQLKYNKLLWAKETLGWSPFNKNRNFYQYYQSEYINCTSKNKVMRFGRRLGKTEGMIVDMLHAALTGEEKILIIAPFQSLIDEIFTRMENMLGGEESIYKQEYSLKKSPFHRLTLSNGSMISGFTTGIDAKSIRGQSATMVFMDEGAYIPKTAMDAIGAFRLDRPGIRFSVASTPSMLETLFKEWCLINPAWREFHYPSSILPNFAEEYEAELRSSLTADGYALEVEADFIEGSKRVFKSYNIDEAKQKYKYFSKRSELPNPSHWKISVGKQSMPSIYDNFR